MVLALILTLILVLRFFNYRAVPDIPPLISSLEDISLTRRLLMISDFRIKQVAVQASSITDQIVFTGSPEPRVEMPENQLEYVPDHHLQYSYYDCG